MKEVEFKGIGKLQVYDDSEMVQNPFSGETIDLEPEAVALYDYIKGSEMMREYKNLEKGLAIFRKRWPKEYMILLD